MLFKHSKAVNVNAAEMAGARLEMCWGECHAAKCHDIYPTGMLMTTDYSVLGVEMTCVQTPLQRARGAAFPQQFYNLCACGQDLAVILHPALAPK